MDRIILFNDYQKHEIAALRRKHSLRRTEAAYNLIDYAASSLLEPIAMLITMNPRNSEMRPILRILRREFPDMLFAYVLEARTRDSKTSQAPMGSIHAHLFLCLSADSFPVTSQLEIDLSRLYYLLGKMLYHRQVEHYLPFISKVSVKSDKDRIHFLSSRAGIEAAKKHIRYLTKETDQIEKARQKLTRCFSTSRIPERMIEIPGSVLLDDFMKERNKSFAKGQKQKWDNVIEFPICELSAAAALAA